MPATAVEPGASTPTIGVFDSGVGGLSVWREIARLAPQLPILYLADQAHVPYGARRLEDVRALTHAAVAWLRQQGASVIVIACNTASAAALESLRQRWPQTPIVGMEPAVKPASQATRTGHVGVLATPGTLQAPRFAHLVQCYANGVHVHTLMGADLVEMVERQELDGPGPRARIREIFEPVQDVPIDHLVLGCTHFPFLSSMLQNILGDGVTLIDPAPAVARQTLRVWKHQRLPAAISPPVGWEFVTTGALPPFQQAVERLIFTGFPTQNHHISFRHLTLPNTRDMYETK